MRSGEVGGKRPELYCVGRGPIYTVWALLATVVIGPGVVVTIFGNGVTRRAVFQVG